MPEPLRSGDPRRLGAYTVSARLGEGGQGVVFLGTAPDGEPVAIKLLRADMAGDQAARRRLAREVAGAAKVARFCTARILDYDLSDDVDRPAYIVSEHVDGPSLAELVATNGPRSGGGLDRLAVNTATALVAIHAAGVVHRDLKPSNVMVGTDGPRVVDFGIARMPATADSPTAELTGGLIGSPPYMAPEQFTEDGPIGPAADVWAWAATVAFAATGRPPFGDGPPPTVMYRILGDPPDIPTDRLPPAMADLLAECLAKDPADRPTASQVLDRLLGATETHPLPAPEATGPGTRDTRRSRTALAGVGILAILTVLVVLLATLPGLLDGSGDTNGSKPNDGRPSDATASAGGAPEPPPVAAPDRGELPGTGTRLLARLDGAVTLTAYGLRTTEFFGNPTFLLDPETGTFVEQNHLFNTALVSPDGRWTARMKQLTDPAELTFVDRISGEKRPVDLPPGRYHNPQWARDGQRLLLTRIHVEEAHTEGFTVVDTENGQVSAVNADGTLFYWNGGGTDIITNNVTGDVVVYSRTGEEIRRLGNRGTLARNGLGPISPDEKLLLTHCPTQDPAEAKTPVTDVCLWDLESNEEVTRRSVSEDGTVPLNEVLGWYDEDHYLMNRKRGPNTWSVALASVNRRQPLKLLTEGPDDTTFLFSPIPDAT